MIFVALLRGINISGKNKIPMKELKLGFEQIGYTEVTTYLNSGNVIFSSNIKDNDIIVDSIQNMIRNKFKLDIPVFVISINDLKEILDNKPSWCKVEDKEIYNNIIFIMSPYTYQDIYDGLGDPNEKIEKIKNYKNSIFWSYILKEYRKTNWWSRTANTSVKDFITIRTVNTITKLVELSNKN